VQLPLKSTVVRTVLFYLSEVREESGEMFIFEKFEAWKRSVELADTLLEFSEQIPPFYQRSLGEQLRRASLSVPTNLAEGTGRNGIRERIHFYGIARASLFECVNLLIICKKRKFISIELYDQYYGEANQISAIISAVINKSQP
jgi:four helix bundle protein